MPEDDFKHCDDYIDDEAAHPALRAFLKRARSPAHGHLSRDPYPKLFATYNGTEWQGVAPGDRVRVVMASRMGDVGCTTDGSDKSNGYQVRCAVADLSAFSDES